MFRCASLIVYVFFNEKYVLLLRRCVKTQSPSPCRPAEVRAAGNEISPRDHARGLPSERCCLNLSYMRTTLTISLPPVLRRNVARAARARHMSESEFVRNAVQRQLWMEAFEATRRKAVPRARAAGIYTDEDVFKIVS